MRATDHAAHSPRLHPCPLVALSSPPQVKKITFRMVRESTTTLRDVNLRVMSRFIETEKGRQSTRREELTLKSNYYNVLDQWQVYHVIDENSPLWASREQLGPVLSGLEVSLIAFDVAYNSDSPLLNAMTVCVLAQDPMACCPNIMQPPVVDLRLALSPAQSASV